MTSPVRAGRPAPTPTAPPAVWTDCVQGAWTATRDGRYLGLVAPSRRGRYRAFDEVNMEHGRYRNLDRAKRAVESGSSLDAHDTGLRLFVGTTVVVVVSAGAIALLEMLVP
jgi:hypothetical protein